MDLLSIFVLRSILLYCDAMQYDVIYSTVMYGTARCCDVMCCVVMCNAVTWGERRTCVLLSKQSICNIQNLIISQTCEHIWHLTSPHLWVRSKMFLNVLNVLLIILVWVLYYRYLPQKMILLKYYNHLFLFLVLHSLCFLNFKREKVLCVCCDSNFSQFLFFQ